MGRKEGRRLVSQAQQRTGGTVSGRRGDGQNGLCPEPSPLISTMAA